MEKIFFITAMLINLETTEIEPKYNQTIFFVDRIKCETYFNKTGHIYITVYNYTLIWKVIQDKYKVWVVQV